MKNDRLLQITSLLAIMLVSLHIADDVMRGYEPVGLKNLNGIAILLVWLCAVLLMKDTYIRYVILFLGSALAAVIPVAHFSGRGVVGVIETPGGLLFVWALFALGVLGGISLILTLQGVWQLRQSRQSVVPAK